jgi:hypothetical protein
MKKYFIYVIIATMALITSCKNDESVGVTIKPQEDEIIVACDTFTIESENYFVPAISAQADSMILGEFYSAKYGTTKAELLLQIAPPIDYRFPEEQYKPEPDSLILMMYYNTWFGSPYAPLEFSVYEINKQGIDYNTQYLSNLEIGDFCDSTILMGKRLMTSIDLSRADSVKEDTAATPYVRYKFDQTQLERFFNMPQEVYKSEDAFLNEFKGIYLTTRYGSSTLICFNQITMYLYYHYTYQKNGKDTVVNTSIIFPSNKEVRQLNKFSHPDMEQIAVCHDSINYIKSAAGIYPKIRIPIGEMSKRIYSTIGDKQLNVNAAEIIIENIAYDSTDVFMSKPSCLLALTTEQFDDFIKYNTIPTATDTTAIIANYSSTLDGYKLNLAYFITKYLRNEMVEDDDVIEMILMPVNLDAVTSTITGSTSVTSIKPLTQLAATTIRSGKNEHSPMRLKILYNGF